MLSNRKLQIGKIPNYKTHEHAKRRRSYAVYPLDALMQQETLAFGHFDVEGGEVELLVGARRTIERDRPMFTVETFPKTNGTRHSLLMSAIKELNYNCVMIDEDCGYPRGDCRNMLCVHGENDGGCRRGLCLCIGTLGCKRIWIAASAKRKMEGRPAHPDDWLLKGDQDTYFPIQHQTLDDMVEKQWTTVWFPREVQILPEERKQFEKMNTHEQHLLLRVLGFFATADSKVARNLVENFQQDVKNPQAVTFYAWQNAMEQVHSKVYGQLINALVEEQEERNKLFAAVRTEPSVRRKGEWIEKWMHTDAPFAQRLIAFAIVEGLFFQGSFCVIFWLKEKQYEMPGVFMSNEFISRDEQLHCEFAYTIYSMLHDKCTVEEVHTILKEAVECERQFMTEALQVDLVGMNTQMMERYIQYTADQLCVNLGVPRIFNVDLPFRYMENLALERKTNFFERRPTDYQRSGTETLNLDEDLDF